MPKSIYAIGGMGLASCLILSFMMQHLLKVKQERPHSPIATEVEDLLAGRVSGRVNTETSLVGSKVVMIVQVKVLAGLPKRRLVESIAPFLWQRLETEPSRPESLRFVVSDDGGGAVETINLPRPAAATAPASAEPHPAAPAKSGH